MDDDTKSPIHGVGENCVNQKLPNSMDIQAMIHVHECQEQLVDN